tara:strand:- start:130904 stop:132058 length:1155 start_codon:yes stop_codon:yes gene_type:complete
MYNWPLMKNSITLLDKFKLIQFILTSDRFTQGIKVEEFETRWSEWLGAKHSLFVTSGSTADFLLVASIIEKYNLKKGDKVLLPACTWVTNINPIFQLGLTPIFCDINFDNFSFDEDELLLIKEKHPDIKIVFTTHLLGFPANIKKYKEIFTESIFIDDVCESHGCLDENNTKIGSDSLGATFSFYFGHHMTTIEGGMISTNDSNLYDLMKIKRSHGLARVSDKFDEYANQYSNIEKSFLFVTDGYNFRNTELSAILGLSQLKKLDGFIINRNKIYSEFVKLINDNNNFHTLKNNMRNSSFCLPFICKNTEVKNNLINKFLENKIEYRPIVAGNLLKQPYINYKIESTKKVSNVDILHEHGLYIGNNQFVGEEELDVLRKILSEI